MPASPPPHTTAVMEVRGAILTWYRANHRRFPWRGTTDPWAVLVSEVMLQQTQASRVAVRFPPFLRRFPTARAMAASTEADVLAAWSGLGYNRRALTLHRAARSVTRAGWPTDVAELERLPGIGPYTARAVAALAFGQPVGAVDTNVRRWLARRFQAPADRPHQLQGLADALAAHATSAAEAAAWMHASMEFGGRVCTARAPACAACPVADGCPSRGAAPRIAVTPQPAFTGSTRAARGRILRALAAAPRRSLPSSRLGEMLDGMDPGPIVALLERDGLAHRRGRRLHLGPQVGAATIAP